jgi:hypothetical protein
MTFSSSMVDIVLDHAVNRGGTLLGFQGRPFFIVVMIHDYSRLVLSNLKAGIAATPECYRTLIELTAEVIEFEFERLELLGYSVSEFDVSRDERLNESIYSIKNESLRDAIFCLERMIEGSWL